MSRSLVFLLLLFSFSSCELLEPIITVSSDAYSTVSTDKYSSAIIYLNPKASDEDLSKLPYYKKIKQALISQGFMVTSRPEDADLFLNFDVGINSPTVHTEQGVNTTKGGSSLEVVQQEDGSHKVVDVPQPDKHEPYFNQSFKYEKVLSLKLRERNTNKLIWQVNSSINNSEKSYAPFANMLVYDAMKSFLKDSPKHPSKTQYSGPDRNRIEYLLSDKN